jgi:NADP-dependent 3-hydroxy acid dehydrogenase YdfG
MIDINIKGALCGIAAALPVFRKQGFRANQSFEYQP